MPAGGRGVRFLGSTCRRGDAGRTKLGGGFAQQMAYSSLQCSDGITAMAKPGPHGKDKQRCGARVRHRHGFCRKWPVPGKERCRLHGGRSTGALTDDGKARSLAAMRDGWRRWFEETRAKKAAGEIERFPGGRKSGVRWVTARMWEQREQEIMERRRAERRTLQRAATPLRRRGRPSNADLAAQLPELVAQAQARLDQSRAQERLTELLAALNAGRK
jgi:hypothetical protein